MLKIKKKIGIKFMKFILPAFTKVVLDTFDTNSDKFFNNFAINTESDWASKIGKNIIEVGGNAMDAAIASCLAIGVVNSFSSGIGGGGFMLVRQKGQYNDQFEYFDFREVAPDKINSNSFRKEENNSQLTGLSVGVPGEILGLYKAHLKYGRLPWKDLFKEPIKLAYKLRVHKKLAEKLKKNEKYILSDLGLRNIYTKNGKLVEEGDIISRQGLAKTLEILSEDPLSFYNGEIADKIVDFIKKNNGVLEKSDLENYEVKIRPVLRSKFYEYEIITTNLPTSGLFIIEALRILERINIRDITHFLNDENTYKLFHIVLEVLKFIFAERGRFGDPDYIDNWQNRVKDLISDEMISKVFLKFNVEETLKPEEYGSNIKYKEDHGTTHLNVIDSDGNIVLITSTINLEFGSKLLDPETGILFNNQIDDFFIPNIDGNEEINHKLNENLIAGHKRPFSSAAPTLLIKKDEIIAIGAAGGLRIPAAIISTIVYLFMGNSLEKSIELCRLYNHKSSSRTFIESTMPESIIKKLESIGHEMVISAINTSFTSVQAIQVFLSGENTKIKAVSDYRKDGKSYGR